MYITFMTKLIELPFDAVTNASVRKRASRTEETLYERKFEEKIMKASQQDVDEKARTKKL